jgi:hypothetical protein
MLVALFVALVATSFGHTVYGHPGSTYLINTQMPVQTFPARIDLDCSDYGVREATERDMYIDGVADPYGLDRDRDGKACETLPSGAWWLAIPTLLGFLVIGRIRDTKEHLDSVPLEDSMRRQALPGVITAVLSLWLMLALPNWLPRHTPPFAYAVIGLGVAWATIHFKNRDI